MGPPPFGTNDPETLTSDAGDAQEKRRPLTDPRQSGPSSIRCVGGHRRALLGMPAQLMLVALEQMTNGGRHGTQPLVLLMYPPNRPRR